MSTAEKLLAISVSINLSVATFYFLPRIVIIVLQRNKERFACSQQLLNLHDEKPWILGKFLVDQLSSLVLTILAVIALAISGIIYNPFMEMPSSVQMAVAVDIGHYAYKLAQDFYLREHFPSFKINALHHIVTVLVLSVFVFFEQNGLNSLVGLLFEGNVIFFGFSHFFKEMQVEKYSLTYGTNLYCGCVTTLLLRGILPLAFLVVSIVYGNPFSMNYIVISFYFLSCIFFLILNLWMIKISFTSVQKFRKERKRHKLERALIKSPSDEESHVGNVEGTSTMAKKSQLPCQKKNNVRYLTPVANTNINTDNGDERMTNLNRDRETVSNIHDALFPVVANNQRRPVISNRSSSISSNSDSINSFTAFDYEVLRGINNQPMRSSYLENIRLGAVRAPPDGEDAKDQQPPVRVPSTIGPGIGVSPRSLPPRVGMPLEKVNGNLSDSSLSEKLSVHSGSSDCSTGQASGKSLPVTLPTIPPPQTRPHLNNHRRSNSQKRVRSNSSTSRTTEDSNYSSQSRTRFSSGDSSKTSVRFPEGRDMDGSSNS
ncbi:uncharacterized protein LOC144438165 [Glandiceps talaboti]